jgi:hypothetical protein
VANWMNQKWTTNLKKYRQVTTKLCTY